MARINAPELEASISAMRELAGFGQRVIVNQWLKEWAENSLNWSDLGHKDIYGANLTLLTHAIETLNGIAALLDAGLQTPGFGLIGPSYSLLRSQLECYWNVRFLLKDAPLRQRNCTAFMYCYSRTHYHANRNLIELLADEQSKADQAREQEEAKTRILDKEHYKVVAHDYKERNKKQAEWYEIYKVNGRKPNSIRDIAEALGELGVYSAYYQYWSAVAHGTAPPLGKLSPNPSGKRWVEIAADAEAMIEVAAIAINQACNTYIAFVDPLLPQHYVELHSFYSEASFKHTHHASLLPATKLDV